MKGGRRGEEGTNLVVHLDRIGKALKKRPSSDALYSDSAGAFR